MKIQINKPKLKKLTDVKKKITLTEWDIARTKLTPQQFEEYTKHRLNNG